ncbi:hypothetical protein BAE44_0003625 [Dichanthelium oligosanthes]|uniref:GTD-binding domain-containing protein n=1 Tax=Dichanthelium oligosanthes TaxID=888268 RepID=A0A1E5WD67_9POAL|nr:hypothetical protein BAE44_0003625 [Dichanthelium oligosanthes]
MTTPCPGAAAVRARWTARSLAGAFLDLSLAWACLCVAALAAAAARILPLPCTCARPHLPCLLAFLARYPSRAVGSLHAALRARFPFAGPTDHGDDDQEEEERASCTEGGADLRRREEARAELQRELEKERSAAASAAEEAMAMILRLQKEKSAVEIEARQQRRTADERCAFYEDEVEELRDIVLVREREARGLRKEVDAYRRLLGLGPAEEEEDDDDDDQEMVTPHSMLMSEGEPSSSRSVDVSRMQQMGNDSGFSFKTPFFHEQSMVPPGTANPTNGGTDDSVAAVQTPPKVPVAQSRLELSSSEDEDGAETEDDGAETVEILPLSARSQDLGADFHVDGALAMESTKEQTADGFQEVGCGGIDKIDRDHTGSENDANVYDVHVVDDICFPTEVKGLIGRSFSDATMQAEKLQTRVAADDLLGKSLNAIRGAQDKIRHAASERRQSLQLQLLEDIANQLQGIKDAAESGRHMYCAIPKSSKKS